MRILEVDTFRDLVQKADHQFGPRVFLENHLGSETIFYTYNQVRHQIEDIGKGLLLLGINKGDRVCLVAKNSPEWIFSYFAITYIGAIVLPIGPDLPTGEILNILNFTSSKAIICDITRSGALEKHFGEDKSAPILIRTDQPLVPFSLDSIRKMGANAVNIDFPSVKPDDVAAIVFTSGTTGKPKGAVLTHSNFMSNAIGTRRYISPTEDENTLCILPLYHTYPFTTALLMSYIAGSKVTLLASYKPDRILGTMKKARVTVAVVVPLFLQLLHNEIMAQVNKRKVRQFVFKLFFFLSDKASLLGIPLGRILFRSIHKEFGPRFRFFSSGGSKLSNRLATFFYNLGFMVVPGYGLTEASPIVTINVFSGKNKIHSVGQAIGGVQIRILNPDGDGIGEILVRGPNVMREIFADRTETMEKLKDGWLYTGDLGYLDSEGYLYICGRKKEVIIDEGGVKIYPEDVEECYLASPLIQEIFVLGVQHISATGEHIEKVEALICPNFSHPKIGVVATDQDKLRKLIGEEIEAISQTIPYRRRVKHFCLTEEALPRTTTGKLKRHEARRKYMAQTADFVRASIINKIPQKRSFAS